jgi:hypothetical protein
VIARGGFLFAHGSLLASHASQLQQPAAVHSASNPVASGRAADRGRVDSLYYLYKAVRPSRPGEQQSPHVLPYAIGVLPCSLTMRVVGNAIAAGSILAGIGLAAVVAIGSTATISLFGATGILVPKAITASLVGRQGFAHALTGIEMVSSLAIFLIGLTFLLGSLSAQ